MIVLTGYMLALYLHCGGLSEGPGGGSENAFALMVSVMQILTLRIHWISSPDDYTSSHALISLCHMQCYCFLA